MKAIGKGDATKRSGGGITRSLGEFRELAILSDSDSLGLLGRYDMKREIGRGGYGIVYLAYDTELDRQVAIKIARAEVVQDPAGLERFRREARAAATMEHPGIVPIFDCGEANGLHFYVMPFVEGDNLARWLMGQRRPLSESVAARIIRDIAVAVHYGHQQGIVHRDLKPQNILIKSDSTDTESLRPVVLDFGLCGIIETGNSSTSMLAGSPLYMSPEQATFGSRRITPRSDIYSLGVILYEMLCGRPPHPSTSIAEAILMLHGKPVEPLRSLRPDVAPAIEAICMKCLRKDPERRYTSAQSLVEDLDRFLDGTTVSARPERWWERLDFAIRFGDWEPRLGTGVIVVNCVSFVWAMLGSLLIGQRFSDDANVVIGLTQILGFLTFVALPIHAGGVYAGWLMTKRRTPVRRLTFAAIFSGVWAIDLVRNLMSDRVSLRIYENQGYVQIMVFLMLSTIFTLQTFCLAAGAWAAWCRRREGRLTVLAATESVDV